VEIDPTTALSVIIKAVRDEGFRNFFISLIWQYLGDYLKSASNTYIVTKDDIELFEKFVRENRAKKTADEHIQNIRRILADLNYELIPERIKEYMLDLQSENLNRARHYATTLKLFIKEIIKPKNSRVAKELYDSFKLPKRKFIYKPPPLSLDTLKKIFNNINDLGARALFLLLIETGLRVGEVLGLKVDQIDLEHRIIKIMKESETKRAYISFLHQSTARWVKEQYLPYREEFVRKYEDSIRKLAAANPEQGINIEEWKLKLFPFREDILRAEIKEAMKKVLGKEFRLYDLRSFFASYMIKQGASPMIVNLLQGRVPPQQFRILQDHYFVISDIELQQYYEKYAPKILE
jgi:Site-specific recombinase XerD